MWNVSGTPSLHTNWTRSSFGTSYSDPSRGILHIVTIKITVTGETSNYKLITISITRNQLANVFFFY